jgi:hypothetical protein
MTHSITISWDPSPSLVDGYNIFRGTAPGNESLVPYNVGLIEQGPALVLSSVSQSANGQAVYTGVISGGAANAFVGLVFRVTGFGNSANNGQFQCVASSATTLTLNSSFATAEVHSALATPNPFFEDFGVVPGHVYSYEIESVAGGISSANSVGVLSVAVPFGPSPTPPNVGVANSFEILAGSTVTNTGATTVAGDVGVWPGTSITGFGAPAAISGVFHAGDFVAAAAQAALTTAYNAAASAVNPSGIGGFSATGPYPVTSVAAPDAFGNTSYVGTFPAGNALVGQRFTVTGFTNASNNGTFVCIAQTITAITLTNPAATAETATASASGLTSSGSPFTALPGDLGGLTLTPGVYKNASSVGITGTLVLDGLGDPNAVFIFQIGSTLTTAASNSNIVLLGGAQAANIFWQVGSSATLGVGTNFSGTIMAQASITVNTGVRVNGRLLARVGAVTLDTDSVVMFLSATLSVYAPNKQFNVGDIVFDCVSQSFQQVSVPGISSDAAHRPVFSPVLNTITQDNTVTWVSLDPPEVSVQISLPPSGPNVPPAPPAAPTNPRITVEV